MRKNEDPRLSFSTPEFKEAQRIFTGGLKVISITSTGRQHAVVVHLQHGLLLARGLKLKHVPGTRMLFTPRGHKCTCLQENFNKPVEWGLIKDHAWSTPQLRKLETPVRPSQRLFPARGQANLRMVLQEVAAEAMLCLTGGRGWQAMAFGLSGQTRAEDVTEEGVGIRAGRMWYCRTPAVLAGGGADFVLGA
jgi:hypothetical protein